MTDLQLSTGNTMQRHLMIEDETGSIMLEKTRSSRIRVDLALDRDEEHFNFKLTAHEARSIARTLNELAKAIDGGDAL